MAQARLSQKGMYGLSEMLAIQRGTVSPISKVCWLMYTAGKDSRHQIQSDSLFMSAYRQSYLCFSLTSHLKTVMKILHSHSDLQTVITKLLSLICATVSQEYINLWKLIVSFSEKQTLVTTSQKEYISEHVCLNTVPGLRQIMLLGAKWDQFGWRLSLRRTWINSLYY